MYSHLNPKQFDDIIQRALDIIQDHKSTMLSLKASLDTGVEGFPHVNVREVSFTSGWHDLPTETFRGVGKIKMLERTPEILVLYYAIKADSYFIKHSVDVPFSLHVCYGNLTCTISGGDMKKGATGEAKPDQLHQLCFPVDTGMVVSFDLR